MRYFSFHEFSNFGDHIVTLSEDEVRKDYWPYWYEKMCNKYGKTHVDELYTFEDCLDDWKIVHWAWEVKE